MPEVKLLKIDHEAKRDIPTTANSDDARINMPLKSIPQITAKTMSNSENRVIFNNLVI